MLGWRLEGGADPKLQGERHHPTQFNFYVVCPAGGSIPIGGSDLVSLHQKGCSYSVTSRIPPGALRMSTAAESMGPILGGLGRLLSLKSKSLPGR